MIMTLSEVKKTCDDWEAFCDSEGFSVWAINEGGGHVEVSLTLLEAHEYGIVKLPDWRVDDKF